MEVYEVLKVNLYVVAFGLHWVQKRIGEIAWKSICQSIFSAHISNMFLERKTPLWTRKIAKCCLPNCAAWVTICISTLKVLKHPAMKNWHELSATHDCTKLCHQGMLCSMSHNGSLIFLFTIYFISGFWSCAFEASKYRPWVQVCRPGFNKISPWEPEIQGILRTQ